ncbi:hypothetical protein Tco_1426809 [Tanacetum coccineum]
MMTRMAPEASREGVEAAREGMEASKEGVKAATICEMKGLEKQLLVSEGIIHGLFFMVLLYSDNIIILDVKLG